MKILLAGLGSIGQRHARNLRSILGDDLELIAFRVRGNPLVAEPAIRSFSRLDAALAEEPNAVIVANPSSAHLEVAEAAVEAGCHVFVEKPLATRLDGVDRLIAKADSKRVIGLVGYHFRFHPILRMVDDALRRETIGPIVAARFVMGEFLPDWHPYEDYRASYAARRPLGGGVLLTQIHEFDIALWWWGLPSRVFASGGHLSTLDIDVEDVASVMLQYPRAGGSLPVNLHLDYIQRPPVRRCEIVGEAGRIDVDLLSGIWRVTRSDGRVDEHHDAIDRNDLFVAEMKHFLACIERREAPIVSLRTGAESLAMALAAKASLETGNPVDLPEVRPVART
jgi:predicted dehydrogenase